MVACQGNCEEHSNFNLCFFFRIPHNGGTSDSCFRGWTFLRRDTYFINNAAAYIIYTYNLLNLTFWYRINIVCELGTCTMVGHSNSLYSMEGYYTFLAYTNAQPLGKFLSFLEATIGFEGMGRPRGFRRFRKTHLENILPRGSRDRDPRYPKGVPWDQNFLLKNFLSKSY